MSDNKIPTLILSPRFHHDSNNLWRAATERGWNTHRAYRYAGLDTVDADDCCVYGELTFCDIMAERLGLELLDPPDDWLSLLPQKYLNREVRFTRLNDLGWVKQRSFVKPANDKVFSASIYENGKDVPTRFLDPECPVLVSEVVDFVAEVRLYILDRKIQTCGFYRLVVEKEPEEIEKEACEWAQDLLNDENLNLPSAVVVDVGIIDGRGWSVVEANQAYSSGIYHEADVHKILDIVYRAAGYLGNVRAEDDKYIRM